MGESAVLVHSYSLTAPITRNGSIEENTIQALSTSISFGKFNTENLDWGKWSTFSHKKYVEEAEKYSRPGSVAQKKAFFEDHYKKIAEAKKAVTEEQKPATPADVLLHTLEKTEPPPQVIKQKEDEEQESERKNFRVDDLVSGNTDDLTDELEVEEKENGLIIDDVQDMAWIDQGLHQTGLNDADYDKEKKLKEELSSEEKEEVKRSMSKNRPVFRLSLEKTIPQKSLDTDIITSSEKTSDKLMINQSVEIKEEKPVHRQRFSFLKCFMGNAKTQEHNQTKEKTEKKKEKKQFLCLCLKPKTVGES